MSKLSEDLLRNLEGDLCCRSELVILPTAGDTGFEEYFDRKTAAVKKEKRLFSPLEHNRILLAYPPPPPDDADYGRGFMRFFESPSIVARFHDFEGCFGIDVTAYVGKTQHPRFLELLSFIRNSPSTTYVLFIYTDNRNEANAMNQVLERYGEYQLVFIPLPSSQQLSDYTIAGIREFSLHIDKRVGPYLTSFYDTLKGGFDSADSIVRRLKRDDYKGDFRSLKTKLGEIDRAALLGGSSVNYGY